MKISEMAAGDDWSTTKIRDLEKQVKQLKQQNTDMITSNQMLKQRIEDLRQAQEYSQS
jgi:cell division protein FtsB